ncbi:hypothetical protein CerSpe_025130 [Prunus speciosa]
MSQAVSNLSIFLPMSSGWRTKNCPSPVFSKPVKNSLRAMARDARDNLDHLQRATTKHQQQPPPQPKRRVAPAPPVGLWDRFPTARTVQQMMETMERMMDDPFAYSGGSGWASPLPTETGGYSRGRTPWEIQESDADYKMRFDMPGMTKEDVKVWVEEKMLVVKAEKVTKKKENGVKEEENNGGDEWSAKSYGRYNSRIALPENIQFEKIKAEVKDGVLYISIPKATSSSKILDIHVE